MENLLTPDELIAILKVPKSWLYGRIHAGTLPFRYCKVGHYIRFPESAVREYIEKGQAGGGAVVEMGQRKRGLGR
jgi:excisionase family DNA binding protein